MFEKFSGLQDRQKELEKLLSDPKTMSDRAQYLLFTREHSRLSASLAKYDMFQNTVKEIEDASSLLKDSNADPELAAFCKSEMERLELKKRDLELQLQALLLPPDKNDGRNVVVEIRAGAGGDEASIFGADLYRLYCRYAENNGWKLEPLSISPTGSKGLKEVLFSVEGPDAYQKLKFESGVHRVQRIPVTEANGRIHTSTVTVAVLAEPEDVEIEIKPEELRIDVFRSSGPGGQSVNTTDSAVRVMHLPTGLIVQCQDEKSQHKNKAKALRVLRARLKEQKDRDDRDKLSIERKSQIGTGERSEKIRTYNYPQNRVTDHRIGLSLQNLQEIMEGKLEPLIQALLDDYIQTRLKMA